MRGILMKQHNELQLLPPVGKLHLLPANFFFVLGPKSHSSKEYSVDIIVPSTTHFTQ